MIAVRMVQVAINEIIDMVPVRHRLVATIRAVPMSTVVPATIMVGRAALGVLRTYFQDMLLNKRRASEPDRMVEVPVMKVIDVVDVSDSGVATV
jgi:hypothetical protein